MEGAEESTDSVPIEHHDGWMAMMMGNIQRVYIEGDGDCDDEGTSDVM